MESARKRQRYVISRLARKVEEMVLKEDHGCVDKRCPVETPEPTSVIASGARQQSRQGRASAACTGNSWEEERLDEDMGENDPPLENPPPEGGGGAGALPGGGGKGGWVQ